MGLVSWVRDEEEGEVEEEEPAAAWLRERLALFLRVPPPTGTSRRAPP